MASTDQTTAPSAAAQQQLLADHACFLANKAQRRFFLELDPTLALGPAALVGRHIRVLWPEDEAWYLGAVAGYCPDTATHSIHYADGDKEESVLALERVRVLVHAGEEFPAPSAPELGGYAAAMLVQAQRCKDADRVQRLQQRATELLKAAETAPPAAVDTPSAQEPAPAQASAEKPPEQAPRTQAVQAQQAQQVQVAAPTGAAADEPSPMAVDPPEADEHTKQVAGDTLAAPSAAAAPSDGSPCMAQHAFPPAAAPPAEPAAFRFGDTVWAKVNGFPPWPALVVTREQLPAAFQKRKGGGVPIVYFGTFEAQLIKAAAVTPFVEGAAAGFHVAKTIKKRLFAAAVCEASAYMREGELPERFFPRNNDGFDDSDSDDDESGGKGGRRPAKRARTAAAQRLGISLQVGKSLRVLSLGTVEWLHPGFHNEKNIWPVGYAAERTTALPGSNGSPVPHVCEVVEACDGSGPLFRVSVRGKVVGEGRSATKAWAALLAASDASGAARGLSASGLRMFGLSLPPVMRAIEALPDAARCERYCAWLDGEQPPAPPPLSLEEQHARLAGEARMHRLPAGVAAVPALPLRPGVCHVCLEEEEDAEDLMLQCDCCGVFVHMLCYGVPSPPHGRLWLCDTCRVGLDPADPPLCALCPVAGGALKRTTCGRWCHPACALWLPETALLQQERHLCLHGLVSGLNEVPPSRMKLTCHLCRQSHGACVQCCHPSCYAACHILCARQGGCTTQLVDASDSENEEEEAEEEARGEGTAEPGAPNPSEAAGAACAAPAAAGDAGGACPTAQEGALRNGPAGLPAAGQGVSEGVSGSSADENAAGAANDNVATTESKRRAPRKKRPPTQARKQGIKVNNARLLVFCKRHSLANTAAAAGAGAARLSHTLQPHAPPSAGGRRTERPALGLLLPAATGLSAGLNPGAHASERSGVGSLRDSPAATAQGEASATLILGGQRTRRLMRHPYGCSKAIPFCGMRQRGQRAPEAIARAAAKRKYVEGVPLLVGGPRQRGDGAAVASTCTWHRHGAQQAQQQQEEKEEEEEMDKQQKQQEEKEQQPLPQQQEEGVETKQQQEEEEAVEGERGEEGSTVKEKVEEEMAAVPPAEQQQVEATAPVGQRGSTSPGQEPLVQATVTVSGAADVAAIDVAAPMPMEEQAPAAAAAADSQPDATMPAAAVEEAAPLVNAAGTHQRETEPNGLQSTPPVEALPQHMKNAGAAFWEDGDSACITASVPAVATCAASVKSSSERFEDMTRTLGRRVVPGKSAIHGWGAFARAAHAEGQMVIEYVGELVRPSVADFRERSHYNSLVGAGTYVFRLNSDRCVDATRAGNLAHLLNHSCQPNCYSRTVPVWDEQAGGAVDHVVIFALREIAAGEELTYDYRFAGDEQLVCNCGAAMCRGMVNQRAPQRGGKLVPRSECKPFVA